MELLAVIAVGGGLAVTAIWLAISRGSALRKADRAEWTAEDLREGRAYDKRKLRAQSETITALERLVVDGGGDSRSVLGVLGEHRRMLSEEAAEPPGLDVRPEPAAPEATPDAEGLREGEAVLGRSDGDGDSDVRDPRRALADRSG